MISEDHVTLKTAVMMRKYSFDHINKLQFNTYSHRKQLFKIIKYFTILLVAADNLSEFL